MGKILIILLMISSLSVNAQWRSLGNVDDIQSVSANQYNIRAGKGVVQLTFVTTDMVRVRLAPDGLFEQDLSWAISKTDFAQTKPIAKDNKEFFVIRGGQISVIVYKKPLRLEFYDGAGNLINQDDSLKGMCWNGKEVRVWKTMPLDEEYYGFGEKTGSLSKRGRTLSMFNYDIPAYKADTDPIYQSIPFFVGIRWAKPYGIFFHNSYWSSFDMGKMSFNNYSFGATGGEIDYFIITGEKPFDVVQRFTELVGRAPLPPRWALGYQQCRWSYYPDARVRKLANDFRSKKIPCDAIYLDIDYMDGYRIFTWSKENFPNPKNLISDLANDGFKTIVIMDPGIKNDTNYSTFSSGIKGNHFLKFRDGNIYIGKVWPGECAFPDFSQPETRDWWGEQMKAYTSVGVRGWWNDMNEPSVFGGKYNTMDMRVIHYDFGRKTNHEKNHNIYGMQMTQATYEGHRKLFTNDRPFILTRASFAGGQRWAAAWTGDNVASWEHLQMAIPMCLNLSVSGQPFVGSDIGGFIGSPDGELYARWLQLSIFTPLMRTHTVKGSADQEPWSYGEEYENINRRTIELRYRLLPYIYTQMWIASQTGIPPMRPLVFQFPKNLNFYHTQTEFMFGNDLFIAPVLWQYERMRELRLPNGKWYDFWSGTKYDGDRVITVEAPMDKIPIFVREGAIIPLQQVMQYSDEKPINPLTLKIFPSQNDTSVYYEDDGRTYNYEKGFYFLRKIVQAKDSSIQLVQLLSPEGKFRPSRRSIVVDLMGQKISAQKVYYGKKLLNKSSKDESELKSGEWMFNEISKRILIFIEDEFTFQEIRIEY